MFTQEQIDKVKDRSRISSHGPSIDFDWFDTVVESACELGILGHEVDVYPVTPDGVFLLVLIVNGVRFATPGLSFEEEWTEEYVGEPVDTSVRRLLDIALREIKKIEVTRDTWYTKKGLAL